MNKELHYTIRIRNLLLLKESAGDWQRGSAGRPFHLEHRVCVRAESATQPPLPLFMKTS